MLLLQILGNIVSNPTEAKFRRLRTSNAKINALLLTKGVRALLTGVGFVEEGDFLVLADDAPVEPVLAALGGLEQLSTCMHAAETASKENDAQRRKEKAEADAEKRKVMRMQIEEDAAARKEPGWKAKAAGVKDGRSIVTASDIGAAGGGG
uniref:PUB domain-containing protein n=1 Tax=Calcidiscus leptoporus TaxID=127549 RepID=A0A7S0IZE5_9EUKA|mmetsp:Transcript_31350/g.72963  ORF Transcript_31350/g.72963 Transcript_31350/m.72963 type:complete len:151 (+) Transcript_31350:538-990(+)